jgi:hypothetical protein
MPIFSEGAARSPVLIRKSRRGSTSRLVSLSHLRTCRQKVLSRVRMTLPRLESSSRTVGTFPARNSRVWRRSRESSLKQRIAQADVCPDPNGLFREFFRERAEGHGELPDRFPPEGPSTFSAHFLHTGRGTTPGNSQSDDPGWLMPDQSTQPARVARTTRNSSGQAELDE